MEPTPGTSYGPPPFNSAQPFLSCTLQSSCSPNVSGGLTSARCSWGHAGDEGSEQSEGTQPGADPGGSTQRRFRSSAFPSSLSWDSDSEKETLDEEELQHFSNPHGLAAHSPGSPSTGLRLEGGDHQEPENLPHPQRKTDLCTAVEGQANDNESTKTEQPNPSQLAGSKVWNVSEGAEPFVSNIKPKEGCQMEEEEEEAGNSEGEKRPEAKETKEPERDVYTFPGDSDPESPPPAPWAHCTFIQRCKKKRVLLRPFSGLGTMKRTLPEADKWARASPQKTKTPETTRLTQGGGVYDFEEAGDGEAAVEEPKLRDRGGKREESGVESAKEIFTCVECSIYFKKQVHLQEHMAEHCHSGSGGGRRSGKAGRFQCIECGWSLPNRLALADHHRRHQESRLKILAEIEKLNENGKPREIQKLDRKAMKHLRPDPAVRQHASLVLIPGKVSDSEIVTSPAVSPAPVSSPEAAVNDSETAPPDSVRSPTPTQAGSACRRRRFVCNKCNFSTRTSQALANHSKTHNRKKPTLQANSSPPVSPSCLLTPPSLACAQCAFLTSSQTVLREHQKLVHPGLGGAQDEETELHSGSNVGAQKSKPLLDSDQLSGSGSVPSAALGDSPQRVMAFEESTTAEGAAARPAGRVVLSWASNRRFSRRRKTWTNLATFPPRLDDDKLPGSGEEEQDGDESTEPDSEAGSPGAVQPHTRARASTDDCPALQSATLSPPHVRSLKDGDEQEVENEGKVFFLRKSAQVTATPAGTDSDDDDDDNSDEEQVRRFLSEGILGEDENDEDVEALKSVERKCPYCPDRFHNGIGLANHVRGHLNRVGVSYNVRHFISPEEVNAIEKKFSYQKKKKKVANFDPDTFSVMHCEFCSAGFDTRAGLSSHARAHLRDFGITNWDVTISPIHILRELFSSRPDLVIPTAPPRSSGSPQEEDEVEEEEAVEEEEEEEEGDGMVEVKLEGETNARTESAAVSDVLPSASPQHWKEEDGGGECGGDEEEAAEEEDEEELQLGDLSPSPGKTGLYSVDTGSLSSGEDADAKVQSLKCEVCGVQFETRRGLSSHARSHLRQLGISVSESSGTPISLLYQVVRERSTDGQISPSLLEPLSSKNNPPPVPPKDDDLEDMDLDEKPIPFSPLAKAAKAVPPSCSSTPTPSPGASPGPPHSASPSSVVRKAPISSLLPVSSPLRSPEHKAGGMKSLTSNLSGPAATTKPLWAPQENDAPLNLTLEVDPNKDIVCQLCGAWFETRKGLSSHARAHLRHFGVEYSESKGSPIDLLNQLIDTDDFKHKASVLQLDSHTEPRGLTATTVSPSKQSLLSLSSSSSSSLLYKVTTSGGGSTSKATSSSASSLLGPPAKRLKSSSMQVFRLSSGELMALPHSEPPKEIGCEFCGEYFENRKGLSSHARSHLRQMGITEWSVNGSPIDTLREIITRRGLPCALPLKPLKTPPPSSPGPPRSPLSTSSSPSAPILSRLPFTFTRPSSPPQPAVSKSSSAPPVSSSGLILKLKPEPVQLEVTTQGAVGRSGGFSGDPLNSSWSSSDSAFPLNLATGHEAEPTRDIRCEFCGEYFENRKGLSSHARSHLRQMGITEWSVNGSPIDTLREVMRKRGAGTSSHSDQGVKKELSQGASSPPWESMGGASTTEGSGYQSSKFRKSPLSLLQSGSGLHKQGLGSVTSPAAPPAGKFFRMSSLGKRPLSEEAQPVETPHSSPHQFKHFSPLPRDFSFKRKVSPDKHRHQDPSCELCGFYFENRKALASHARAHLRQFGVTEWCVNGSPIETLSAWIRSRPQKVLEMHRSYMQGNRSTLKKKSSSPLRASEDSDDVLPVSPQKASSSSSSSSQWSSSLALSLVRPLSREVSQGSSKAAESEAGTNPQSTPIRPGRSSPGVSRLASDLPLQAQVARSELNVRLPRGFERRPLKHPSCPDGPERDSGPPKPPRTGTVPALVPKPPSYPLVKLVGKFYTLKCRFCEVEFHGPLSVQEDWIRHLQQHILKMNYNKPAAPRAVSADPPASTGNPAPVQASAPASTSSTTSATPGLSATAPSSRSPTPLAERAPTVTATEIVKVSEQQPPSTPTPVPLTSQTV